MIYVTVTHSWMLRASGGGCGACTGNEVQYNYRYMRLMPCMAELAAGIVASSIVCLSVCLSCLLGCRRCSSFGCYSIFVRAWMPMACFKLLACLLCVSNMPEIGLYFMIHSLLKERNFAHVVIRSLLENELSSL